MASAPPLEPTGVSRSVIQLTAGTPVASLLMRSCGILSRIRSFSHCHGAGGWLEEFVLEQVADQPRLGHLILMCSAVNAIDASALESLEAINHRLADAGSGCTFRK
jgi:hypothetical protein